MSATRLTVCDLEGRTEPAAVWRRGDRTIVAFHVWADRYDLLRFLRATLTEQEYRALRDGFGWSAGTVPLSWLEEAGPVAVPESLWLPLAVQA